MTRALQIDRNTGHVHVAGSLITPAITPEQLGAGFQIGDSRPVLVGDREVPCRFARTSLQEGHLGIDLSLRFESEQLVSLFIALTDPSIPSNSDDDFYASIPLREKLHQRWLSEQLGELNGTLAHFPWGTAGIARDKSENVFIYLHNRNNSWVFSD
ncbi:MULTISPECIES: hypothetical protein [unclassified Pseudomonas]|uniref:hypothetical protein n=1 Tax=unclassified Pseudomonas TaxID=196821 RepID=UPI002448BE77|nr:MULTISPECIES: hypothetical protein [unclassified Pseudomonas]MDG9925318.1 hypothetical protein [Pseudomonas sp. GD04045]MDH0036027.1 hypothetical protein [Pseudomonas sp. GD04019]